MKKATVPLGLTLLSLTLVTVGLPGLYERIVFEHSTTGFAQQVPWGLWVAAYLFFSGMSAGAFPVAALSQVFGMERFRPLAPLALLTSLVSLAAAMVMIMADLGRPERAFHLILSPNPGSVMFWVISLYTGFSTVVMAMLWYTLRPRWAARAERSGSRVARLLAMRWQPTEAQETRDRGRMRAAGVVGLVFSFCLAAGVGMLFSVLSSRAFWHTGLFPITFLVSALASGASMVVVAATLLGRGGAAFKDTLLVVARVVGFLLVVEAIILPVEILVITMGAIPADLAVLETIGFGPHAWVFWVGQLGVGTIGAMLLILAPRRPTLATSATGALMALIGTFAFRLNFVIPQQALGLDSYMPNMYEWNLVVFGAGLAGLLLVVGHRLLPVLPNDTPFDFELALRGKRRSSRRGSSLVHPAKGEQPCLRPTS